jgi:hypothetical protein
MATHYDELHSQGIRVQVFDSKHSGPFQARVSCGVTRQNLGGVENCQTVEDAIEGGKKHARKFAY